MLFAVREESERFDVRDLPVLTVPGVDDAAAGEILADHLAVPVAAEVRAELLAATGGNPLGLVELSRGLTADQLSGRERLPHRLPVTKGVEGAFLGRYRRLSVPAQTLLDYLDDGYSLDEFLEMFPSVDREDAAEFLRLARGEADADRP